MSTELTLLLWSLVPYALSLSVQAGLFRIFYGIKYAVTARDEAPQHNAFVERAERALKNFLETYPAFIVLMIVAHLADPGDPTVFWGAVVWLVARLVYLPLYLFGVVLIRSLVWIVSAVGLCMILAGLLF